jgi:hypothetical protein
VGYNGSNDNPFTPLYSLLILVWITWFCKRWRRTEARLAFRWNVEDSRETERERPEFDGPRHRGFYSEEGYWVAVRSDPDPKPEPEPRGRLLGGGAL